MTMNSTESIVPYTLDYYLQFYTLDQIRFNIIAMKVASSTSFAGSTYIIQDILKDPQKRKDSIYHRVMLGVAGSDLTFALTSFLGTWAMPKGQQMFAIGSEGVCNAVGVVALLGFALSLFYNCSLATYYHLRLKNRWNQQRMEVWNHQGIKVFEKWLHIVPWLLTLVLVMISTFTGGFGPWGLTCSINSTIISYLGSLFFSLAIIYVVVVMSIVYRYIRDIEKRALAYSFSSHLRRSLRSSQTSQTSQASERKRSRRVMIQGIMYAVAMILIFLPFFVDYIILDVILGKQIFFTEIIVNTSSTLQGVYNGIIYSGKLQNWCYNYNGQCWCCNGSICNFMKKLVSSLRGRFFNNSNKDNLNKEINSQNEERKEEEMIHLSSIVVEKDALGSRNNYSTRVTDKRQSSDIKIDQKPGIAQKSDEHSDEEECIEGMVKNSTSKNHHDDR